jgi:hypothetical protein
MEELLSREAQLKALAQRYLQATDRGISMMEVEEEEEQGQQRLQLQGQQ